MSHGTLARFLGKTNQMIRLKFSTLWAWEARFKGVEMDGPVSFWGRPIIGVTKDSRIRLGPGVAIASAVRANPIGCFQPSVLRTLAKNGAASLVEGLYHLFRSPNLQGAPL